SGPGTSAWAAGQRVQIRSDWEAIKVDEMYNGNLAKFQQNDDLRTALINSGNGTVRFTGSTPFWNKWNGLIMERIRAELRQNGDEDARRAAEIRDTMNNNINLFNENDKRITTQLFSAIILSIIAKQLCVRPDADNHWAVRNYAPSRLAQMVK
ncbi:unnamed protein product, partial [Adineta steineri]